MCSRAIAAAALAALLAAPGAPAGAAGPATGPAAGSASGPAAAAALLRAADAALHPIREGIIRVRATVAQQGAEPVVSIADVYIQAPDKILCVFREGPLAARRILTVRDRAWLIVPGSARAVPVRAGQRLLGGASIADVAGLRFDADFEAVARPGEERVGDTPCVVLDLRARDRAAPYASGALWIGRDDGLARRAVLALASGAPAKEVHFTEYRRGRDGMMLVRMRILHRLAAERGMETDLELLGLEPQVIDPDVFTPDGARRPA